MTKRSSLSFLLDLPEFNVMIFAFLLNHPWEFLQVPFFEEMPAKLHWEAVQGCTQAALGDMIIMLLAFWSAATYMRSRLWILAPRPRAVAVFLATGLAMTIFMEWVSTRVLDRWSYSELMPVVPLLQIGLIPLLQWTLLPLLVIWFVKRQLS